MKVVILPAAQSDINALFLYIEQDLQNPIAARNVATKILLRIQMLANFPELGPNLANIHPALVGYRYLIVSNYIVIYKVVDQEVRIIRTLYARADYIQMLQG